MFEDKWQERGHKQFEVSVGEFIAYIRPVYYPNHNSYQVRVSRSSPRFQVVVKAHKNYSTLKEARQAAEELASMLAWLRMIDEGEDE